MKINNKIYSSIAMIEINQFDRELEWNSKEMAMEREISQHTVITVRQ